MAAANAAALTKQAIALQKAGDRQAAANILVQAVQNDPTFEMAWLWLSSCVLTPGEKRYCLDRALAANPNSQPAKNGLDQLGDVAPVLPAVLDTEPAIAPPELTNPPKKPFVLKPSVVLLLLIIAVCLGTAGIVWFTSPRPSRAVLGSGTIAGYDSTTQKRHISEITLHAEAADDPCPCGEVGYAKEGQQVVILEMRGNGAIKVRTPNGIEGWTQIDFVKDIK